MLFQDNQQNIRKDFNKINFIVEIAIYSTLTVSLSLLENIINPTIFKIGFANTVILLLLRKKKYKVSLLVTILKIIFGAIFSGSFFSVIFFGIFISSSLSYIIMYLLSFIKKIGPVSVSITSSIFHNLILLLFSSLIVKDLFFSLWSYIFLFSIISGGITGYFTYIIELFTLKSKNTNYNVDKIS